MQCLPIMILALASKLYTNLAYFFVKELGLKFEIFMNKWFDYAGISMSSFMSNMSTWQNFSI